MLGRPSVMLTACHRTVSSGCLAGALLGPNVSHIFRQPPGSSWVLLFSWVHGTHAECSGIVEPPMQVISERLSMSCGRWTGVPGWRETKSNATPFPKEHHHASQRSLHMWQHAMRLVVGSRMANPASESALDRLDEAGGHQTNVFGLRVLKTTISLFILSVSHCSSPRLLAISQGRQDVGGS
jgi:hypothetical protein